MSIVTLQHAIATLVPILAIFGTSIFVKSGPSDGASVPWRPDPWVFITVWIFIAILTIAAWNISITSLTASKDQFSLNVIHLLFILVLVCAAAWQILYHQNKPDAKKQGVVAFVFLLFFLLPLIMYLYYMNQIFPAMMMLVLLVWSIFAMRINIKEVENVAVKSKNAFKI
jgi:tryptophan-rich sensory protein